MRSAMGMAGRQLISRVRHVGRPRLPRRAIRLAEYEPPDRVVGPYFLPAGYRARDAPEYYVDVPPPGITYPPDVYRAATRLAQRSGSSRLIDIGCGNAEKLAALHPRFDVIGIDIGENLARCRARYPWGIWIEHDLESSGSLPLEPELLSRSVLICADVLEHLRHPERALTAMREKLGQVEGVVISTPDRERLSGTDVGGPPGNPSHVREWTRDEFAALVKSLGFENGLVTYTRPHTGTLTRSTVLAILVPERNEHLLHRLTWLHR